MKNDILDFFSHFPKWIQFIIFGGIFIWIVLKLRAIFDFLMVALFGKDKEPNYKEMTGALGFIQLAIMFSKHNLDSSYVPNEWIGNICVIIVLTLAGIAQGSKALDKYLETKSKGNESEGMDV